MSSCLIWVQTVKEAPIAESARGIRLFVVYRRYVDLEQPCFRHYITVIGYRGGGVQEECAYRIDKYGPAQFAVFYTSVSGPLEWEQKFSEGDNIFTTTPFDSIDKDVLNEIQARISTNLHFNEDLDCFVWNAGEINPDDSGYYADNLFPLKHLKFLSGVYWPFLLSFT